MAWRFRKSISLGKFAKINISKSGIGGSLGVKGARIGLSSKGKSYTSVGIPGTGLYKIDYEKKGDCNENNDTIPENEKSPPARKRGDGCLLVLTAFGVIFLLLLAVAILAKVTS